MNCPCLKPIGRMAIVCLFTLGITGCPSVYSHEPIGKVVTDLQPGDWQGMWGDPGKHKDSICIKVLDAEKGELLLEEPTSIRKRGKRATDDEDSQIKAILSEHGSWEFLNVWNEDEKHYSPYRIKRDDDMFILWEFDVERIAQLIEAGRLPGLPNKKESEDDEVKSQVLTKLQEEHLDFITSDEEVLFLWDEPVPLFRVSKHCIAPPAGDRKGRFRK